jgi:hypothetical protein
VASFAESAGSRRCLHFSLSNLYLSLENMMKQLKAILLSFLIGVLLGLWFGVNIGREVPFYSNPFDTHSLHEKLKDVAGETLEKGGHALEKTGQSLQDKINK